jgi:hypothetical protein
MFLPSSVHYYVQGSYMCPLTLAWKAFGGPAAVTSMLWKLDGSHIVGPVSMQEKVLSRRTGTVSFD